MKKIMTLVLAALGTAPVWAEIRPERVFTDNMVLQRGKPVPVWGLADPGEKVSLSFAGQDLKTVADDKGRWQVVLASMEAKAVPGDLTIGTRVLKNVLVGGGLMAADKEPDSPGVAPQACATGTLRGFAIAGEDRKWFWADAVIDGNDVVVSSPSVPAPVAVRYAFRSNPMGACNLYNKDGLPASPFRTDDW